MRRSILLITFVLPLLFSSHAQALEPEQIDTNLLKGWAKTTSFLAIVIAGSSYYYRREGDRDLARSNNLSKTDLERQQAQMDYLTDKSTEKTLAYFSATTFILSALLWHRAQTVSDQSKSAASENKSLTWEVNVHENRTFELALAKRF